ncbi:MAG: phosphodiester glycosidase family protein [Patescibacteria group bacterium]
MKRIFTIAVVVSLVIVTSKSELFSRDLIKSDNLKLSLDQINQTGTKVLGVKQGMDIEVADQTISVAWVKIENIDNLKLIANFNERLTPNQVKQKYNCQVLVNGGFYMDDTTTVGNYKPIGLFIGEYKKLADYKNSTLLSGVISINDFATPRITTKTPKDNLRVALQNGPLLIENNSTKKLTLTNENNARRIVAATTGNNELYFLSFYNPDSAYLGPKLVDLPKALTTFEKESGIDLADALNLDGGNASVYLTPETSLSSSTPVGSYFCEVN